MSDMIGAGLAPVFTFPDYCVYLRPRSPTCCGLGPS